MDISIDIFSAVQIVSTICLFLYVILMTRQNVWCWIFGILSSAFYIISCIHTKLYLEGILNFYYVIVGFYGWYLWLHKNKDGETKTLQIGEWRAFAHIANIFVCAALTFLLGRMEQKYTTSPRPFFDAAMTVFSFSATILEARKILSAWIYWFVIDGAGIALMIDRDMKIYALQNAVLTALCVKGYLDWRKNRADANAPMQ